MIDTLYLHVPFCEHICFYCDFKRTLYEESLVDTWLLEIEKEIKNKRIQIPMKTIYIGGGTPTALSLKQLENLLKVVKPYTNAVHEYTMESNLESIDEEKLRLLKRYGVNRISLGVQSYDDKILKIANRKHRREDISKTIDQIKYYITNISIDLIYGFVNQSIESWRDTLYCALKENIEHISIYSLTIEEHSVFAKRNMCCVANEIEAKMYEEAIDILTRHQFYQYEVANFAKKGYASKHNIQYWKYRDFYGIGVGASGKEHHQRYTHKGSIKQYVSGIDDIAYEQLKKKDEMFEYIMMNLRLYEGIDIQEFNDTFQSDFMMFFKNTLDTCINDGYLRYKNTHISYTKKGLFQLHDVLVLFLEAIEKG
ncbi:MAG: radical SAM family heme chaperone HemW [Breznakia sp.]